MTEDGQNRPRNLTTTRVIVRFKVHGELTTSPDHTGRRADPDGRPVATSQLSDVGQQPGRVLQAPANSTDPAGTEGSAMGSTASIVSAAPGPGPAT